MPAKFSRRGFLGLLATSAVGACVATKIPTSWLPPAVRTRAACEFLRQAYNDYARGKGFSGMPRDMYAGRELFEAYEGELSAHERFVWTDRAGDERRALMFKGARLYQEGRGWTVRIAS